jgi:(4S)-4-hydroxy-5-phosphonooxypentane-2,3-dione isomerase
MATAREVRESQDVVREDSMPEPPASAINKSAGDWPERRLEIKIRDCVTLPGHRLEARAQTGCGSCKSAPLGLCFDRVSPIGRHMLVVHVHVRVKAEYLEAFKQASLMNARESLKEPGVARFDVVQQQDDPARFVLVEVYRDAAAAAAHKETKHYPVWRDAVAPMMAEPRFSVKFSNLFPDDAQW